MPQRNVSLTEPQDRFIENSVATGRFRTADEAVGEALRLLEDADKVQWLKTAADEAWYTFDRGEYVTLSSDEEISNYVRGVSKLALDEHAAALVAELRELRLIDAARRDLESTLQWSYDRFGAAAAERYASLIEQSFLDMRRDPFRVGSRKRADTLGANVLTYHLSFSRDRVPGERVQNPRHFLLYRVQADAAVEIGRILHDSRDLPRHVPGEFLDDS